MKIARRRMMTAAALLALLAPLSPALAAHCGEDAPDLAGLRLAHSCDNGAVGRCAGLWSSACCDFSSPARSTQDVPGGFDRHAPHVSVVVAAPVAFVRATPFAHSSFELLLEDRAGPPHPRLLSTVRLI